MKKHLFAGIVFATACICGTLQAQPAIVLEDFSGTLVAKKQPSGAGDFVTWYDSLTRSSTDPAASLDPSGAMRVQVDKPINGTYRIFEPTLPSGGEWHVNCTIRVVETSPFNTINNYQLGAIVNGVHRGTGNSKLAPASIFTSTPAGYLTTANDTPKGVQKLRTPNFTMNPGNTITISLGTDVTSGNFNLNAGTGTGNYVIIDDIVLEPSTLPVSLSGFTLE